ncbi:MAG: hypothetical protein A2993_02445 [Gammaproteobacteria bacterium RIFCSPLOWO2_01_FULL_47_190]|nr:MAG: hypothetical protein A2993_02445 [Gammaproteobacteria bacterium RIFCSPLOWO2_01_FULL_47_190]
MKKVAVLLDLGHLMYQLYKPLGKRNATADEIAEFANKCALIDEEIFRIYCYHCEPFDGTELHPLTRVPIHFKSSGTYKHMSSLLNDLSIKKGIAYRAGELQFNGWLIKKLAAREIAKTRRPLIAGDFEPDLKQKRVDMKIGLDVAWLSSKSIVDRILLVTADSDFVPAMKFARREGVQVVLIKLNHSLKRDLMVHADEVREIVYPPAP